MYMDMKKMAKLVKKINLKNRDQSCDHEKLCKQEVRNRDENVSVQAKLFE